MIPYDWKDYFEPHILQKLWRITRGAAQAIFPLRFRNTSTCLRAPVLLTSMSSGSAICRWEYMLLSVCRGEIDIFWGAMS